MKILAIIFFIYAFLKGLYYGIFELKEKKNKPGGIATILLSLFGLILPILIIFLYY